MGVMVRQVRKDLHFVCSHTHLLWNKFILMVNEIIILGLEVFKVW